MPENEKQLRQVKIDELTMNPFQLIGSDWMLVTAGNQKHYNTMTASWGTMGVMWGKNVACTVIRPQRYTHEFVENNEYFTLSFYPEEYKKALSLCGSKSGRDVDKAAATGLTPVFDEQAPYFSQAKLVLVCRKIYRSEMKPEGLLDPADDARWYPEKDYHTLYVGEIVKVLSR
ncbi:MAG TPA: flavin reductase family protein [Candidatus Gallacutalibacter stercoravium]|nr:flavin reductase family protein [Candidatus Gallacutalibacter stercoravium]